jgi:NADH-quinone oxidoreductase subunit N
LNWLYILPEIIVAFTAIVIIIADLVRRNSSWSSYLAIFGVIASFTSTLICETPSEAIFNGMFLIDGWSRLTRVLILAVGGGVIVASINYRSLLKNRWAEFNALILFALLGMMLMPAASNLISVFVSIQLTTIPFFILVGIGNNPRSSEASLKMFLTGAVASAILLYGMAFIFGVSGTTNLAEIGSSVNPVFSSFSGGLLLGILLIMAGMFFEIGAVPFHMWLPDTYEGAPTPITMYLSAGSKVAGIAIIARTFSMAFTDPGSLGDQWGIVIAIVSAITMTVGNILALNQKSIKRLLAYSGIAHTGYMLIGIATIGTGTLTSGDGNLFFYMTAFALAEIAVFSAIIIISQQSNSDHIEDYSGIARRSPLLATTLSIGLLSLMGLPLTAGFMGKLFVFTSAVENGLLWLVIIGVINTVISAYYYLSIIRLVWTGKNVASEPMLVPRTATTVSVLSALIIILLGVAPALLINIATNMLVLP